METDLAGVAAADLAVEEIAHAVGHGLPPGAPCPNCATPLQGPWCHACGQNGEEYNRSILHLAAEAAEGLTHIDGRLWRTLDRVIRQPGRLTRDYLDGHRAPQIPPFRMFLVVVVLVFLAGSLGNLGPHRDNLRFAAPNPAGAQKMRGVTKLKIEQGKTALDRWMIARIIKGAEDPEPVLATMEHWAHQFAILSLLVAAPLLALAFIFQRQFYFFDHLIFSMHSLSFQGLLLAAGLALSGWVGGADWLYFLSPVHLFFHLRGVYGTSINGTLARMAFLFVGSVVGFSILMLGLILVGLAGVH
jgi:hypothetical protein